MSQTQGAEDYAAGTKDESLYGATTRAGELYRRGWQEARRAAVAKSEGLETGRNRGSVAITVENTPEINGSDPDACPFGAQPVSAASAPDPLVTPTPPSERAKSSGTARETASALVTPTRQDVLLATGEEAAPKPKVADPDQLSFF